MLIVFGLHICNKVKKLAYNWDTLTLSQEMQFFLFILVLTVLESVS